MLNNNNDSSNNKSIKFRKIILLLGLLLNSGCFIARVSSKHLNCNVYYDAPGLLIRKFKYIDTSGKYVSVNDLMVLQTISGKCH